MVKTSTNILNCATKASVSTFDCAAAGLTIGHTIISEFLTNRVKATQPGQKTSASNEHIFTMLNVLAKTNATALASLKRAEYHEKMTRT